MAGTVRLLGRLLRGLIAAVVLAALVVGLPWALVHYVGWPLPHHVPTGSELQGFLLAPMSVTFLLDFLACACWIVWFFFTLDVLRCTVGVVRGARWPDLSGAGPMHTLAGVLVGAVLLSVLGNRPAPPPSGPLSAALGTGSPVVATAPAWQNPASPSTVVVRQAVFTTPFADSAITDAGTPPVSHPVSVIVRAPENGVHDSLWRIAQRTLGDGARWPEIWHANEGKPQPGGRTFTQPSLIYPGEELDLPATASAPPSAPPVGMPAPAPAPTSPPPASPPPAISAPTTTPPTASSAPAPAAPTTDAGSPVSSAREPGFRWGPDLFVGLGLAAAISAALAIARRRYRSRYRPGSGDRDDFPVAPVVYQLRLAHLRAERDDEIELDEDDADDVPPTRGGVLPLRVIGAPENGSDDDPAVAPRLGVRDGREIALNLAVARGLGLVGAGAPAAARVLLVTALSSTGHRAGSAAPKIIVPADDLVPLLGRGTAHTRMPASLRVADSLQDALDALEAEILVRAGTPTTPGDEPRSWPPMVLAATVPQHQRSRLQAVLDNGSLFGITGLLLGQWQPGVTCYVRADGTVSATSPGLGQALRGSLMFRLGEGDTAALLVLLGQADPEPPAQDEEHAAPRPRLAPPVPQSGAVPPAVEPVPVTNIGGARPVRDTDLEITAVRQAPVVSDTELEILGLYAVSAPGVRLRPSRPLRRSGATAAPQATAASQATIDEPDQPAGKAVGAPSAVGKAADAEARAAAPVRVAVLGAPRVFWRPEADTADAREVTNAFQRRTRELLVFLAVHPDGASREALVAALWPDAVSDNATNAMNTALSRLRRSVSVATGGALSDIVVVGGDRYRLDPAVVDVDFWRFDAALAARRAATSDQQRVDAYRAIVDSYCGPLADGMSTEWIETAREGIRRDAIDAVARLARALVADDPQQTLDLLEIARAFDPHNEALYRDIMRLQERLGLFDAIPRTLTLLTTRLAEVDNRPSEHAIGLAARLRHRHDGVRVAQRGSAATVVPPGPDE
ncbi:BTAD domain-containing putative transcriptional regulator [Kutzneria sp. NPDC051319]|uniref:BTAD domain-containing putative transcriptional regulator n=1 Tax=Kutzneria sp. NPDC051319 TaxID=3155047 RepID=UPI00341E8F74